MKHIEKLKNQNKLSREQKRNNKHKHKSKKILVTEEISQVKIRILGDQMFTDFWHWLNIRQGHQDFLPGFSMFLLTISEVCRGSRGATLLEKKSEKSIKIR